MAEELFDLAEEYEAMLSLGLDLSGENWRYFLQGRVKFLLRQLPSGWKPVRILDFGCGLGHTTHHLAVAFPDADIVGVDTSHAALAKAREVYGDNRVRFQAIAELSAEPNFDLCYTNGVFHHIEPSERPRAVEQIRGVLRANGFLALFENNPWNLGTRLVMKRIPFDRTAKVLSVRAARKMLNASGAWKVVEVRSLFYFPRFLSALRPLEESLSYLPLGAQYCVLAQPTHGG